MRNEREGRVLIVDPDEKESERLARELSARGFRVDRVKTGEAALEHLDRHGADAIVADLALPGLKGKEFCERCAEDHPETPLIAFSSAATLEIALTAVRAGACDFLTRPLEADAIAQSLERAKKHRALRQEVTRLRKAVADTPQFSEILGASPPIKAVRDMIERVADTDSAILVTGETGTGKELVARALLARSHRARGPFVVLNCSSMPEPALERELLGEAKADHPSVFARANGGTLFLDEVAELPPGLQAKLGPILEAKRVGSVAFDARIVAASNRVLEDAVSEGRFREDLFYRLNVVHVRVPPLRVRGSDVLLLAQHFLEVQSARAHKNVTGIASGAAEKLIAYSWPGNVRELQSSIESAVALAQTGQLRVEDLPEKVRSYSPSHVIVASDRADELLPMEEVERRYIVRVLEAVGGNKTLAAQILGLDRKTLYRKLDRYASGTRGSGPWKADKEGKRATPPPRSGDEDDA